MIFIYDLPLKIIAIAYISRDRRRIRNEQTNKATCRRRNKQEQKDQVPHTDTHQMKNIHTKNKQH